MKTIILGLALAGSGYGVTTYFSEADQSIDRAVPASREELVVVRIPEGQIAIEGWRRDEIQVTGRIDGPDDALTIESGHGHTELRLARDFRGDKSRTNITVRVPFNSSLDVETEGGSVRVSQVAGIVRFESETGDLQIEGEPSGIVARSQTGNIQIDAASAPGIVHSEHGAVRLNLTNHGLVESDDWPAFRDRMHARRVRHTSTWDHEQFGELGERISQLVGDIVNNIDVDGFVEMDRHSQGLRVDMSGEFTADFEVLGELFAELGSEIGASMAVLSDELGHIGEELGAEIAAELEHVEDLHADRHRDRRPAKRNR